MIFVCILWAGNGIPAGIIYQVPSLLKFLSLLATIPAGNTLPRTFHIATRNCPRSKGLWPTIIAYSVHPSEETTHAMPPQSYLTMNSRTGLWLNVIAKPSHYEPTKHQLPHRGLSKGLWPNAIAYSVQPSAHTSTLSSITDPGSTEVNSGGR